MIQLWVSLIVLSHLAFCSATTCQAVFFFSLFDYLI